LYPCTVQAYTFDPLANLTAAQQTLFLGGQKHLLAEQSGLKNWTQPSGRATSARRRGY
jgi:hypothetical protein